MQEEFQNTLAELQDVEAAEVKVVGVHAPEVSATVFTHWKFEEKLIETIRYCVNPENAPETIKKAAQSLHVARTAVPISGVMTEESIAAAKELVDQYGLDMDSFDKAIENVLS
jgi:HD-like signal output (HDOD) protein